MIVKWSKRRCLSTNGMLLRTKIILTIWPHKNITITRVNGGFVQTRQVPILCQWSTDLTLNKHCLPCSNWNRKKKELKEINNGHRVLLLLLHGGVGKVLGGLLIPMKVTMEMKPSTDWTGSTCWLQVFGKNSSRTRHSWIQLLCHRWIVYSWRRSTVTDGSV